ncbi:MAG: hypothetical protein ACKO5Q_08305, partial [Microcystaceae cyanobacterium]
VNLEALEQRLQVLEKSIQRLPSPDLTSEGSTVSDPLSGLAGFNDLLTEIKDTLEKINQTD